MKINEVEQLVGISKRNIRFYEKEGLLSPGRNADNGYRDYGEEDVETLRKIKLLRKLDVPLEEIRRMQQGELTPFWADGIKYYVSSSNGGYEGDLEVALVPDSFREDVLGEKADGKGVLFENTNVPTVEFALGFQVDGDVTPTLFWFYNCTATRPNVDASTTEDTKEPGTDTLTVSCGSTADGTVRAKTTDTSYAAVKDTWFTQVYQKSEEA